LEPKGKKDRMEGSGKQKKRKKKVTKVTTFPIPFALGEIKKNITTNTPSKPFKEQLIKQAIQFHSQGNILEAEKYYQYFINQGFKDHRVYSNYGAILKDLGKYHKAELLYRKAIEIKSDYANAYANLGDILKDLGKFQEAEFYTRKAIKLNPKFTIAYYNLGNLLKAIGNLKEAELSHLKAIELNPSFAKAHANLGNVLKALGKLKEAEISTREAIRLNPNIAEAHNILGNILTDIGKIKEASLSLRKAIEINPNLIEAAWNFYGLADSIEEAVERINECLKIDKNNLNATLTLSALKLHQGNQSLFLKLIESNQKNHPYIRSFKWLLTLPNIPKLFFHRWALFDSMIKKSKKDRPFYEFGVWHGVSFQYLINAFKEGYGFDTFKGLPEDWHEEKKGTYSADGIIPIIDGGTFIDGKFEETLPIFFAKTRPVASIINFDADLYSSTLCALNYSKSVIDQDTILIFDEFIMNKNWEQDEFKALNEFCSNNNLTYEVLAVSYFTKQVALKLIGI
jgi:Flp pilus assembly protein TadD